MPSSRTSPPATGLLKATTAPAVLGVALVGQHQPVAVDDAGRRRQQRRDAGKRGLQRHRLLAVEPADVGDAVGARAFFPARAGPGSGSRRWRRSACRSAGGRRRARRNRRRAARGPPRRSAPSGYPSGSRCRRGSPRNCATTCRCRWRPRPRARSPRGRLSASARATASPTTPAPTTTESIRSGMIPLPSQPDEFPALTSWRI